VAEETSDSKQRIQDAALELLSRHGYTGTGIKAVSEACGLPYGSIYHHFPGGKEELVASAMDAMGEAMASLLTDLIARKEPAEAVHGMFAFMADRLEASDWADGCMIGTPAQDGPATSAAVRESCARAFARMGDAITDGFVARGLGRPAARDLASTMLSAYEGATLLARVQRSRRPMDATSRTLQVVVRTAFAG
jgi:TetR/AcrR family transcriptional repressor of lmrAB and yxaGH operons